MAAFKRTFLGLFLVLGLLNPAPALCQEEQGEKEDPLAEIRDPLEPVNRGIFWFNDHFDYYVFEPVAQTYDDVLPEPIKKGIGNFFTNLRFPQYLLSDLLQLKLEQAAVHTGRFLMNSTVGLLGLIDVAKEIGWEHNSEDFGLTLASWGVPPGPYLVIPIIGPSNLRDTVGLIVDAAVHPFAILGYTDVDDDVYYPVAYGGYVLEAIDTRAGLLDAVEAAKSSSLDYYLFMQSAYYQYRHGELHDGKIPGSPFDDEQDPNSFDDDLELEAD